MAKDFVKEFGFPGDLYVDQKRLVYEAFNCKRGLKYALNMRVLKAAKDAMSQGFSQGRTEGDGLQLGGVFVISKSKGILFEHLEQVLSFIDRSNKRARKKKIHFFSCAYCLLM